jgi:hypothetical protein
LRNCKPYEPCKLSGGFLMLIGSFFFDLIYHLLDIPNLIVDGKLDNLLPAGVVQCDFMLFFCVCPLLHML